MIVIANLLTVNAICSLTGKMFEYEYEREHYLPGRTGKPALVKSRQPGWGLSPGRPSPDAEQQQRLPTLCTGRWEQDPCLQLCQHTSNLTQLLRTTGPFLGFPRTLQAQPRHHAQPTAQRGWIGHSHRQSAGHRASSACPKPSAHPGSLHAPKDAPAFLPPGRACPCPLLPGTVPCSCEEQALQHTALLLLSRLRALLGEYRQISKKTS